MTAPLYSRLLLIVLAGVGVILVLLSTVWGAGATPDSATYVSAAHNLQAGHGLWVQSDIHQSQEYYSTGRFGAASGGAGGPAGTISRPLTQYPPLFPILLAVPGLWGSDPLSSARLLNTLLFAANILLVGVAIQRYSRGPIWPAPAGALLVLTLPDILTIHAMAWSEPAFIFFAVAGCLSLAGYLDSGRRKLLLPAAAAVAAASLTRYVGVVLILTGCAAIIMLSSRPLRRRIADMLLFAAGAGLPLGAWFLRNAAVAGSFANRESVYHPLTGPALLQAWTTVAGWIVPFAGPHPLRISGALIGLAVLGVGASLAVLRRQIAGLPLFRFSILLILFSGLYLLFLAFTLSFYDAATPLDGRILSPVFVTGLILVLTHLQEAISRGRMARRLGLGFLGLGGALVGGYLIQSIPQVQRNNSAGINYTGRDWRQSDTVRRVQALPADALIYTNAPDAIYLLTGRTVNLLPPLANIYTQQANTYYAAQMGIIRAQAAQQAVYLVYFYTVYRMYLPQEAQLRQDLPLLPGQAATDGVLYPLGVARP